MKHICTSLLLISALSSVAAADAAINALSVEGDVIVGLPLGDFGDVSSLGIGALIGVNFRLQEKLVVTGRAGYMQFLTDIDGLSLSGIPLWGGVKYYPSASGSGVFASGEAGITMMRSSFELGGASASDSESNLSLNLGGGFDMGKITLRGGLGILDIGEAGDSMMLNASAGYTF